MPLHGRYLTLIERDTDHVDAIELRQDDKHLSWCDVSSARVLYLTPIVPDIETTVTRALIWARRRGFIPPWRDWLTLKSFIPERRRRETTIFRVNRRRLKSVNR